MYLSRSPARSCRPLPARAFALHTSGTLRTSTLAPLVTAAALASTAALFAQTAPPGRTMSADELRPGMTGYGLTVFHGTTPERFPVEVVEVLHNARPQMDMILIRPTHPVLERAGTVAGMSGSPIYINDRLIGAYAYGWDFGRETIAGVTPIANMLAALHRPRRTPPGLIPGSQVPLPIVPPAETGGGATRRRSAWDALTGRGRVARAHVNTPYGQMVPLAVPFGVAGMSDGAIRYLAEAFEPFGIEPVQVGGAGRRNAPPPTGTPTRFENGGSISVDLIAGDISGASTGTVTYVQGNDVLAFGHPMMGLGEVAFPTSISRVAWVMASLRRSHKMAEPVRPMGALQDDRPFTIVVNQQGQAPTVPVHVHLNGNPGAPRNDWNVTVAYHRALFGRLVGSVVGTVLETAAGDSGDIAWTARSRVVTEGHGTLQFTDHGASAEGTGGITMGSLGATEALERLTDNPFEQVRIERVDVDIDLRWARDFYYLRSIALSRAEVDPGETVQLLVSLGQYAGAPVVRSVPVVIPREVAGREVELEVAPGGDVVPDLPEPESVSDLIRNISTTFPDDSLVVSMRLPGVGVTLRGRVLPNLPSSALDTLRPSVSTEGGDAFANVQRIVVPVNRLVLGRDRVRLHVRDVRQ